MYRLETSSSSEIPFEGGISMLELFFLGKIDFVRDCSAS